MNQRSVRDGTIVFSIAFLFRLLAVLITTITSLNTYSQYDSISFANNAEKIASTITSGTIPALNFNDIYQVWGAMLSPFWLLPGPSRIYARVGMALLGAMAVYNVYVIARHYHSKRAGAVAVLPLVVFPSFLFVHATVLREAMVLFGLTSIVRLLLAPGPRLGTGQRYAIGAVLLTAVVLLRRENLPVYALALVLAAVLSVKPWRRYPGATKVVAALGTVVSLPAAIAYGRNTVEFLADIRRNRARGDSIYLGSVIPNTILETIAFSWIGAAYFLFAPFPWMVTQVQELIVMAEGVINVLYAAAAIVGTRVLATKTIAGTAALVVSVALGSVLYGVANANFGAAVRQRQMVLWVIFLLGGIGFAEYARVTVGDGHS